MHHTSTRSFARALRRQPTEAERLLWSALRGKRLDGFRFTRQAVVGPYIVDFLCRERMLVIEVDGATHGDAADVRYDARRTEFLESLGYSVMRVDKLAVFRFRMETLDAIHTTLVSLPARFGGERS